MKLTFGTPHKSIRSFPEIELPDFIVLTGVNGAGKSHLLEAIENGYIRIEGIPHNPHTRNIRRFDWATLVPNDNGPIAGFQVKQERSSLWAQFSAANNIYRPNLYQAIAQIPSLSNLSARQIVELTPERLVAEGIALERALEIVNSIQSIANTTSQNIVQHFNQHDPHNRPRLIEMMRTQSNVPFVAFEEDDFYENIPPTWQPVDMFQQSFARLFAEYQENWRQNEFKQWQNSRGRNFRVLDKAAFVAKYGTPPWEFVNNILETARLDFRINAPDELDDRPYEPTLTDLSRGTKVKFNDLSSGERVLELIS